MKAKPKNNSIASQQSAIVQNLCSKDETIRFESKRVSGKMVHKALETVVAFANPRESAEQNIISQARQLSSYTANWHNFTFLIPHPTLPR